MFKCHCPLFPQQIILCDASMNITSLCPLHRINSALHDNCNNANSDANNESPIIYDPLDAWATNHRMRSTLVDGHVLIYERQSLYASLIQFN